MLDIAATPNFFFLILAALAHPPKRKKGVIKKNSGEHARSEIGYPLINPKGTPALALSD